MYCLRAHLRAIDCPYAIAEVDALLHSRPLQGHDGAWEYTRPSVPAYREPQADPDPAGAFHVDDDGAPDLVIEILSRSTRKKDIGVGGKVADKMEHFGLFRGFRLQDADYRPIDVQAGQGWPSAVLGTRGYWATNSARRRTRRSR